MSLPSDRRAVLRRALGYERNGDVTVRNFDQGVIETLGATVRQKVSVGPGYYLDIPGVQAPPTFPGIPVVFTTPEDVFEVQKMPWITVARDDVATAIQRWHPGSVKYRAPRQGAIQSYVEGNTGFDGHEEQSMSEPVDFTYTITANTTRRTGLAVQGMEKLWYYIRKVYKPYGLVIVKDSLGDSRTYNAFREAEYDATENAAAGDRVVSMGFSIRVEGELDIEDPFLTNAVRSRLTTRLRAQ